MIKNLPFEFKDLEIHVQKMLVRLAELEKQASGEQPSGMPIGALLQWTSDTSLPIGYLKCEGQAVSRSTYSALFNIIGTTFGTGNGSSTFNLPNFKGLVARGAGTQSVDGRIKDGGTLGQILEDQMQRITGSTNDIRPGATDNSTGAYAGSFGVGAVGAAQAAGGNNSNATLLFNSANSTGTRVDPAVNNADGETRVSSLSIIWIIRAQNLETVTATESAIDALNARVTDNESDISALQAQPKWALLTVQAVTAGVLISSPDCPASTTGYITRVWNTLNGKNISFVSNSSGTLTINETGVYKIKVRAYAYRCNQSVLNIFKNSSAVAGSITVNAPTGTTGGNQVNVFLDTIISFSASDTFTVEQFLQANTGGTTRFGFRETVTTGVNIEFASLFIEKIS